MRLFHELASSGFPELLLTVFAGLVLVLVIAFPALRRWCAPWVGERNEVAATGETIRAVAGILILLCAAFMLFC